MEQSDRDSEIWYHTVVLEGFLRTNFTLEAPADHAVTEHPKDQTERTSSGIADHVVNYRTVIAKVPTANQRSRCCAAPHRCCCRYQTDGPHDRKLPHGGTRGARRSQEVTSEEQRIEQTGRGNVRLPYKVRWRRATITRTTVGKQNQKRSQQQDGTNKESNVLKK